MAHQQAAVASTHRAQLFGFAAGSYGRRCASRRQRHHVASLGGRRPAEPGRLGEEACRGTVRCCDCPHSSLRRRAWPLLCGLGLGCSFRWAAPDVDAFLERVVASAALHRHQAHSVVGRALRPRLRLDTARAAGAVKTQAAHLFKELAQASRRRDIHDAPRLLLAEADGLRQGAAHSWPQAYRRCCSSLLAALIAETSLSAIEA